MRCHPIKKDPQTWGRKHSLYFITSAISNSHIKKDPQTWGRKHRELESVGWLSLIKKDPQTWGRKRVVCLDRRFDIVPIKKDPQTWGRKPIDRFIDTCAVFLCIKKDPQTWGRKQLCANNQRTIIFL